MECENAALLLGHLLDKRVTALRDVSLKEFKGVAMHLPENLMKRARHVITENERVQKAARAANGGDAVKLGQLMSQSQASLRDDFEASSPELELMVELAQRQSGCLGSRLTGAGWGGATVNLVRDSDVDTFMRKVAPQYKERTGLEPWIAPVVASHGAGLVELEIGDVA
jgi:galactokinase